MKIKLSPVLKLIVGLGSLASVAQAAPGDMLTNRKLTCDYVAHKYGSRVKTEFFFILVGDQKSAVIKEYDERGYLGKTVADYTLTGSELTVDRNGQEVTYDLANPSDIARNFQFCFAPGQGGGDSSSVCEEIVERCTLE